MYAAEAEPDTWARSALYPTRTGRKRMLPDTVLIAV
jgi:hypothetical protein